MPVKEKKEKEVKPAKDEALNGKWLSFRLIYNKKWLSLGKQEKDPNDSLNKSQDEKPSEDEKSGGMFKRVSTFSIL